MGFDREPGFRTGTGRSHTVIEHSAKGMLCVAAVACFQAKVEYHHES